LRPTSDQGLILSGLRCLVSTWLKPVAHDRCNALTHACVPAQEPTLRAPLRSTTITGRIAGRHRKLPHVFGLRSRESSARDKSRAQRVAAVLPQKSAISENPITRTAGHEQQDLPAVIVTLGPLRTPCSGSRTSTSRRSSPANEQSTGGQIAAISCIARGTSVKYADAHQRNSALPSQAEGQMTATTSPS
jgi:hypothetical protein